ncbi:MAG: MBL fold metallo-hydrolase [Phycisphaerales bacterium]
MSDAMISDVRWTVLGSGTSAGVPIIGCDCRTCTSDDPRDRRLRTSGMLQFTDAGGAPRVLLLDTSPDLREQALRHRLRRCDGIHFSHNHVDHVWGLDETRRFNVLMDAPIEIFADENTMDSLHRVYQHVFQQHRNVNPSFVATLIPHVVQAGQPIDRLGLRATPLTVLHGRLPVICWRFDALNAEGEVAAVQPGPLPLAWCTDTSSIPPETWPALRGLRTLFLDMLRERAHPTHFTREQAMNAAERIAADRTWFIHMTHDLLHAEASAEMPDGMDLAWDGLQV